MLLKSNICIAMETSAPSSSYTRAPGAGYAMAGSCAGPHPTTLGETRRDETADPGGDGWDRTRDFTSLPCRAQPREPPFKEEKASTVFSGSFFLLVTLDTVPLSTAPRAFSWGGKEGTKSTKCIWGGE